MLHLSWTQTTIMKITKTVNHLKDRKLSVRILMTGTFIIWCHKRDQITCPNCLFIIFLHNVQFPSFFNKSWLQLHKKKYEVKNQNRVIPEYESITYMSQLHKTYPRRTKSQWQSIDCCNILAVHPADPSRSDERILNFRPPFGYD
jgi:hypothetical protein